MIQKERKLCIVVDSERDQELLYLLHGSFLLKKEAGFLVHVILLASDLQTVKTILCRYPLDAIWVPKEWIPQYQADIYMDIVCTILRQIQPSLVWGTNGFLNKSIFPRIAVRLHAGLCADCTGYRLESTSGKVTMLRQAMNGNVYAEIATRETSILMATVRLHYQDLVLSKIQADAMVINEYSPSKRTSSYQIISPAQVICKPAKQVIRRIVFGLGDGVQVSLLDKVEKLANYLNASIVCTRKAAPKFVAYEKAGITGMQIAPDLYIAIGISGASQHMEGIHAKTVISVNHDPNALINEQSDYYIIEHAGNVIQEWLNQIQSRHDTHPSLRSCGSQGKGERIEK